MRVGSGCGRIVLALLAIGCASSNRSPASATSAPDAGEHVRGRDDAGAAATDAGRVRPEPEPLPSCGAPPVGFDATPLATGGEIAIGLSAWLVPTGVNERAFVDVLGSDGDPDPDFAGTVAWTLPEGVEIVAATPAASGQAEVTFRFAHPGTYRLEAQLDGDPRTGFADVMAYTSELPIWELQVDPDAYARLLANPESDEEIPGTLRIEGTEHPTILRLHGGSSRYYPKRSFRFELQDSGQVSGSYGKKLILRAEWNDKTLLRNWLALRMLWQGTRVPTSRSKLVHFRVNDRYYGVMHNVERVDSRLLDRFALPRSGSMYEADPIKALAVPGANLTPLAAEQYPDVYPQQNGTLNYADLRALIEDTLSLPDDTIESALERELDVASTIDYLALMAAIQNQDHVRKNYYLYRDPASPRGWQLLPWDLDLTFGHLWSEENDVLEEAIVSDGDIFVGVHVPERGGFYNQLIDRMLTRENYRARFQARVGTLLDEVVTAENASVWMNAAIRCATPDLVADSQKRATNAEYLGRVAEIGAFLDARKSYVAGLPKP